MRFELVDFAAFDIHILRRRGAADAFDERIVSAAEQRFRTIDEAAKIALARNTTAGLPGAAESWSLDHLTAQLETIAVSIRRTLGRDGESGRREERIDVAALAALGEAQHRPPVTPKHPAWGSRSCPARQVQRVLGETEPARQ